MTTGRLEAFWLSVIPFVTGWIGENHFVALPTAVYGVVLLASAVAYSVLQGVIIASPGPGSRLAAAVGADVKGKLSPLLYAAAIPLAFVDERVSDATTPRTDASSHGSIAPDTGRCPAIRTRSFPDSLD